MIATQVQPFSNILLIDFVRIGSPTSNFSDVWNVGSGSFLLDSQIIFGVPYDIVMQKHLNNLMVLQSTEQ